MVENLLLALRLIWPAGLGVSAMAALGRDAQGRWLLRGAALSLPAALLLYRFRWMLGGRERLEALVALSMLVLLSALAVRRWRNRPLLWGALGFLLPQKDLWGLAEWPFRFTPLPIGASSLLSGTMLIEWTGIVLGLAGSLVGLALVAQLGRNLAPRAGARLAMAGAGLYAARNLVVLAQMLFSLGLFHPGILFGPFVTAINLLERFPEITLGIGLLFCLLALRQTDPVPALPENPAELRKVRALNGRRRRLSLSAGAMLLAFVGLGIVQQMSLQALGEEDPPTPVTAQNGELQLPRAELDDHHLHHYVYTAADGTEIPFLAIHKAGSSYGLGLNYCEICGRAGYTQRGDTLICNRCGSGINRMSVGFPGGCNPVPIQGTVDGEMVHIEQAEIEQFLEKFVEGR